MPKEGLEEARPSRTVCVHTVSTELESRDIIIIAGLLPQLGKSTVFRSLDLPSASHSPILKLPRRQYILHK